MTGPQPASSSEQRPSRLAAACGIAAACLLLLSLIFPYWQAHVFAPQYPGGLKALMYATHVGGDAGEIDNLNHYIGVRPFGRMARLERILSVPSVILLAALCVFIPRRPRRLTRWLMALPVFLYPLLFVADMAFWMRFASTHLDPMAPLKLKPFSIPVWGSGQVAQFRSEVGPQLGFYLVIAALLLLVIALMASEKRRPGAIAGVLLFGAFLTAASSPAAELSLQEQITQSLPGAVIDVPPGRHLAPLIIDKPITLRGRGAAIVDANGRGTVIAVRAPGVVLDGLIIRGSGDSLLSEDSGVRIEAAEARILNCQLEDVLFGLFISKAPDVVVEDTIIRGKDLELGRRGDLIRLWYSDRPVMRRNRLVAGRDTVLWYSNGSVFEHNVVEGGRYGLHFMYTNDADVAHNTFRANSVGAYMMYSHHVRLVNNRFEDNRGPSGAGLGLKDSNHLTVRHNQLVSNRHGIFIDQSPTIPEEQNRIEANLVAYNETGMALLPGVEGNVITGNTFMDNLQQIGVEGGGQLQGNVWAENERGNYWSDYAGYGGPGAAVGKTPYRLETAFEDLMDRHPLARFFAFTPAAEALNIASRAFPLFKPKAKVKDPYPLLQPPVAAADFPAPNAAAMSLPLVLLALPVGLAAALGRKRSGSVSVPVAAAQHHQPQLIIEAHGLQKSFGPRVVLRDAALSLRAGESVVLWGPNGAGKSTLLKCVLGLQAFEGTVRIAGLDMRTEGHIARRHIGYLAQEPALYDWTVRETLEFVCGVRGVPLDRIPEALTACHLAGEERKAVRALSGGMKQKLALAQALIAEPDLLVLDEPCSNLDLQSRREMIEILRHRKGRCSLLMTSHHLEEVEALADRVVWMQAGQPAEALDWADFHRKIGRELPLWVRLENAAATELALACLQEHGYCAVLDGDGFFVNVEPRKKMDVVRLLEGGGFTVRDIRQEGPA